MKTIESQMNLADEVIHKLRAVDPSCIVAGGAPRDWHFGNIANDIDIYIWQPHKTRGAKENQLNAAGFNVSTVSFDINHEMYKKNSMIDYVFNAEGYDEKVQIISLNESTYKVVNSFPFSICQAWYIPERGIQLEKNFRITEKTGYIFKTNPVYADGDNYIQKITERFKDKFKFARTKEEAMQRYIESL